MNNYLTLKEFIEKYKIEESEILKVLNKYKDYKYDYGKETYINEEFYNIFLQVKQKQDTKRKTETAKPQTEDIIIMLKEEVKQLKAEIKEKDERIYDLQNKIIEFTISAQVIAEKSMELQQQRNYIEAHEKTNKKGFLRLFQKKEKG